MKYKLIIFEIICCLLSYVLSKEKFTVQFYLNENKDKSQTEFEMNKGSYLKIYMGFELADQRIYQIIGKIITTTTPFKLSNDIMIDTLKERLVPIYIGVSCLSSLEKSTYQVTLSLMGDDKVNVIIPDIKITIYENPVVLNIIQTSKEISAGSYGIYTIDNRQTYNVDEITVTITKTEGREETVFNNLNLPPYDNIRTLQYFKSSFSTPLLKQNENINEQKGAISLNNACYKSNANQITFIINNKSLPNLSSAIKNNIVNTITFESNSNNIIMNIDIKPYPVLLSCAIKNQIADLNNLITKVRNMNLYVKEISDTFYMTQSLLTASSKYKVTFQGLDRWIKNYQVLCVIEDTNYIKEEIKLIYFLINNENASDKKIMINPIQPQSSYCSIWKFTAPFQSAREFCIKASQYCSEHFATLSRDKGKELINSYGCIQCDINYNYQKNSDEPHKAICIRSANNCPTNTTLSLQDEFEKFTKEISTKTDIEKVLGEITSEVKELKVLSSNLLPRSVIATKIDSLEVDKVTLTITNKHSNMMSCIIKNELYKEIPTSLSEKDFKTNIIQRLFEIEETHIITIPFSNEHKSEYDNKPYNILFLCSNMEYGGNYYSTFIPFIGFTFLKTQIKPIEDEPSPIEDCEKTPFIPQCLNYGHHNRLPYNNPFLFPEVKPEFDSFVLLPYTYQNIMLEVEYNKLKQITVKSDLLDQVIYFTELLTLKDCINEVNYSKCRSRKMGYMEGVISKFKENYACPSLVKDIQKTSPLTSTNIVLFTLALHTISNNPDSFNKESYPYVFEITNCLNQKAKWLINLIKKYYSNNPSLELNTRIDFLQLLITHSVNLFDVSHYLEADQLITPTSKNKTYGNTFIIEHLHFSEDIFIFLLETNVSSIVYDNFYYEHYHRRDYIDSDEDVQRNQQSFTETSLTKPMIKHINNLGIKVEMNPLELFKQTNSTFIYYNIILLSPIISLNCTTFSHNMFTIRGLVYNENNWIVFTNQTGLDTYPIVKFNSSHQKGKFKQGYRYNYTTGSLEETSATVSLVEIKEQKYYELTIKRMGSYTIGIVTTSYWLMTILIMSGLAIFGGSIYYIFKCCQQKRMMHPKINYIQSINTNLVPS